MSSVGDSPDRMQSHYSLRWHNHQHHMLTTFETLLQQELLVDVTLICDERSFKAHKVVLSACSPFFERIFSEHPCKHPMIVLKDFTRSELSALIDFMYRGEVKIAQEELPGLMKAAECLKVRGLSALETRPVSAEPRPPSSASTSTRELLLRESVTPEVRQDTPEEDGNALENTREIAPILFQRTRDQPAKLPLINHINFGIRESCGSPLTGMPRRKQARPRRRSSELVPQDLSRRSSPLATMSPLMNVLNLSSQHQTQQQHPQHQQQHQQQQQQTINNTQNQQQLQQQEDMAENLSMKKSTLQSGLNQHVKTEGSEATSSPRCSPLTGTSLLHPDGGVQDIPAAVAAVAVATGALQMSLPVPQPHPSEYLTNLGQLTSQWLPGHPPSQLPPPPLQGHHSREESPHGPGKSHSYQQRESSMMPRRSSIATMFSPALDSVATLGGGLFSHASAYDRGNLLADSLLADNFKPEALQSLFNASNFGPPPTKKSKKHRNDGDMPRRWNDHNVRTVASNRPKGQHSAPRGGPPRSWTNKELKLALEQVWGKRLTTSQASRMYGIPYNSLLMYVRGKYGKSLKLEELRDICTGASNPEITNNNNVKPVQQSAQMSAHPLTGLPLQHPGDNGGYSHRSLLSNNLPQPQGYYPTDFGAPTFPMAVNMVHLLPPSEQVFESSANPSVDGGRGGVGGGGSAVGGGDGSGCSGGGCDLTNSQSSETPSPIVDHHHHHESSMQPQSTQSVSALQNGSD